MEDKILLKMIANPYLFKKNKEIKIKQNNNENLYKYLKNIYPKLYIPPYVYSDIEDEINNIVIKYQSKTIADKIISNCLKKFDKNLI